jgi:BASS family bile acid:Na+ symporter
VGQRVDENMVNMFLSIVRVIVMPIALGFICTKFFSKITSQITKVLPLISVIAIVMIVAVVVSANSAKILTGGFLIVAVVALHNLLGYASGYGVAKLFRLSRPISTTVVIEVGMQNSGLATSLADTHFAAMPLAVIPGSIFANIMAPGNERAKR